MLHQVCSGIQNLFLLKKQLCWICLDSTVRYASETYTLHNFLHFDRLCFVIIIVGDQNGGNEHFRIMFCIFLRQLFSKLFSNMADMLSLLDCPKDSLYPSKSVRLDPLMSSRWAQ
jgi:hypothetical protein